MDDNDWVRFTAKTKWEDDCCLWIGSINAKGYGEFGIGRKTHRAHRIALEHKLGRPISPNMDAAHICRNRNCVNPDHLEEKTHKENLYDKMRDGTWGTKLTVEQASIIRSKQHSIKVAAELFGVSTTMVKAIRNGSAWKGSA